MAAKPGDSIGLQFVVQGGTGALTNADSLPTATHVKNGVDDAVPTALTVTNISTGLYKVTGTLPVTYSAGDRYQIRINATVSAIAAGRLFDFSILDARRISDISDSNGRMTLAPTGLNYVSAPPDLANDAAGRATFIGMIRFLYNRFANKVTQTATTQTVYGDDGTTVISTMNTSDDGTTQTKGKSA